MAIIKVYSGGQWISTVSKLRSGGNWYDINRLRSGAAWIDLVDTSAASYTVSLTGASLYYWDEVGPTYNVRVSLKIDNDGNVYKYEGELVTEGSEFWVQISSSTDWIRPVSANDGSFYIRVQHVGDALSAYKINGVSKTPGTTWQALNGDVYISLTCGALETKSATVTIAISSDGSTALDSGTFFMTADTLGL